MFIILGFYLALALGDGQFECGEHGRFEYCIDEIPGCVIGCHCHPGYYFDTESKICEPNIKLTQNYRRYLQPYEANMSPTEMSPKTVKVTEAFTTKDPVDYQVDEITKNTDDLGDWLYNQFFKTIESQVINNTEENKVPSRRSGTRPIFKNISRRKALRKKNRRLKQNKRKSSMRRKLLRITENDSVFDSSESRSYSSDSSSDESATSFEIEQNEEKHTDDREHGHKKIVIINKKQKPPLPSFIFLPNMDTPFYPPIGLPPPPIMPMYPIVPVPPMPAFPCPDHEQNDSTTSAVTTSTAATTSLTISPTVAKTSAIPVTVEENVETSTNSDTSTPAESKTLYRGGRNRKRNKGKTFQQRNNNFNDYNGFSQRNLLQAQQEKLLQRIRQKSRHQALKHPIRDDEITEIPLIEDNGFDDTLNNEIQSIPTENFNPQSENVDFKYISELIHRAKINNTRHRINPLNSVKSVEVYKPVFNKINQQAPIIPKESTRRDDSEDSYYTNLGRQIASIIRSADAQNQQVNIEIEHTNQNNENHVFLNDNSPKSFWERSVRSPVTFLNSNKNKFDYLKKNNQLLFDIENKVSIVASTVPSLSLHEIENMISVVEKAQRKVKNNQFEASKVKESTRNFNINLWPQDNQLIKSNIKFQAAPEKIKTINGNLKKMPQLHGLSMHNFQRFTAWLSTGKINQTQNNKLYKIENRTPGNEIAKYPTKPHSQLSVPIRLPQPPKQASNTSTDLRNPLLQQQRYYSMLPNHKYKLERKKYFQDISNEREDDGSFFPMNHLIKKPVIQQPSYFHHGINHFDYF